MFTNTPGSARFQSSAVGRTQLKRSPWVPRTLEGSHTNIFYRTSWYRFFGKGGGRHVYITRRSKKGGVIGEPWFPIQ